MYLSKVTLKQSPKVFKLLSLSCGSNGYVSHQLLWSLFPNDGDKIRDFLFHRDEKSVLPSFLVLSREEPVSNDALDVQTKMFEPQISEGQKLGFSLVANPVVARKTEGKKHSIKHDVWMDAKKQAREKGLSGLDSVQYCESVSKNWLIKQGDRSGFSLTSDNIIVDGYLQNCFYKGKGQSPIRFSSIHYEGVLTVTDPEVFKQMLGQGLGKSKAFGCGLMLIRRI